VTAALLAVQPLAVLATLAVIVGCGIYAARMFGISKREKEIR
jgi:hypothetical protein